MKKALLLILATISFVFGFSQQIISKRISINNPTQNQLLKIKDAGIDLSCGAIFKNNNLILEVGPDELKNISSKGINYTVLIDDLIGYYKKTYEAELPLAKKQLELKKSQSKLASKSQSTKSTTANNYIQYEGCSEVNWSVPTNFNLGSMGGCLTYSEVLAELDQMRALYPNLISIKKDASPTNQKTHGNTYSNGGVYNTWAGQPIYYVRISDNPDVDEINEPESLYTGMTHAREVSSMMNLIYYMWYLLENYNTDNGIKNLVDNHEMYFIPVANPDGLMWNEQIAPSGGGMQRKNLGPYNTGNNSSRGVDLNRNYNYFWGASTLYGGSSGTQSSETYRGPSAFSEPETQIVRDFSATRNFKTAINHHANSNLIPHAYNGYPAAPASGRESEYAKFCHDMTRFNRYIYGEAPDILTIANGDMSDWMLGGVADINGATGSGQAILALAPENGAWDGSEGGFWPNPSDIVSIAQRAMRMNFVNAYYSGKFAQLHDLNPSNISSTNGNLKFGIEYLGQTLGNITLNITPISSNIISITSPATQTGWNKLEQRTINAAFNLSSSIQANDEIEFQVTLTNDDGYVMYKANIIKYYNPTILITDNPDVSGISNWTAAGGSWGTTTDAYSGTTAITDSPSAAYSNNQTKTLTLNSPINLSASSSAIIQFYAKWDLERNFDYVQIQGSTNGTNWVTLCGKYTKPGADYLTTRYSSAASTNTSTGKSTADQNNQPTGDLLYDGDTMDKWVMEEILIDATENSALFGASSAHFRFVFDSDNSNRADGYPTTFDGFIFDDFKIIGIQIPCAVIVPTGLSASNITQNSATLNWNNIPSATFDLRYRIAGSTTWTNVTGLSSATTNIASLSASTNYEVQVRSNCNINNSEYSSSYNFTTASIAYCASNGNSSARGYTRNVTFGSINNTTAFGSGGYSDFTSISTNVMMGSNYSISIGKQIVSGRSVAVRVWIDYNRDGDFDDANELILNSAASTTATITGTISIPQTAVSGNTRMRVSLRNGGTPVTCGTFTYGEVEDYSINIQSLVDTTPPVITLNGTSNLNLFIGDTYSELGATASDNKDGNITANIVISGSVNTSVAGAYTITYNVSDAAGNQATQVSRTVNVVPDTTAPVITLNGASTINLNVGDIYTELGATATDNKDGNISANIVISGSVNTSVAGSYIITYNVSDAAGNQATQVSRTVNVVPDTTAPVITLNGASTINLNVGDTYTELGATASDNKDGNITANIVISGSINTAIAGSYTITYNVSDAAGNQATQVSRTVNVVPDTTAPVITLNGASTINLNVGDTYTELGATASDNKDGNITANIVISGSVNTSVAGSYTITYNVSDAAGNQATQVSRTIIVTSLPTNVTLHQGYFETGTDGWSLGSGDAGRYGGSRSYEGSYSLYIRDNSGVASSITSPVLNLSPYNQVEISFYFYPTSMETNEDFWLLYYNGSTWTNIATYVSGTHFNNNSFYTSTITLNASQYNFANNAQFRFQCDASANDDLVYIDQVIITGINGNSSAKTTSGKLLNTTNEFITNNHFIVYPNPVNGAILNIKLPKEINVSYKIINTIGQVVITGKTTKEIPVGNLQKGTYFIEINDGEQIMTKKFIKN